MTEELTNDSILQFYIAETRLCRSLKTRLFHRHNLVKDIAIKNIDDFTDTPQFDIQNLDFQNDYEVSFGAHDSSGIGSFDIEMGDFGEGDASGGVSSGGEAGGGGNE